MTKATSIAVMFGVWTAGLAAAAAAYAVHEPLPVPPAPDPRVYVTELQPPRSEDPGVIEEEEVLMMPEDTIVATVRHVAPKPVRAELRCNAWVALAQGPAGAQVRYCE